MDGILKCNRYAFGPNRLHYCGPDKTQEIFGYIKEGAGDKGLGNILKKFKTIYLYLRLIAEANNIKNPFDDKVVEAYWLGNTLLETVEKKKYYRNLMEEQEIKKRVGRKSFEEVAEKIVHGAVPHHSFHVLNIWRRTGHLEREHTLESMDQCRISWGKVIAVDGPFITVETEPLVYENGKLKLGEPVSKRVIRSIESFGDIAEVVANNVISIHWGVPCEAITPRQTANLKKYTLQSISFANQTI